MQAGWDLPTSATTSIPHQISCPTVPVMAPVVAPIKGLVQTRTSMHLPQSSRRLKEQPVRGERLDRVRMQVSTKMQYQLASSHPHI